MTLSQAITLCYVLLYFIIAGQAVFYKFCFTRVFGAITGLQFVAIRKLADPILATRLALVYYSSLLLGMVLIVITILNGSYISTVIFSLAFMLLLADVILARKFNIPINTTINGLVDPNESVCAQLQIDWLRWIDIRGNFILAGFILLNVWLVFY